MSVQQQRAGAGASLPLRRCHARLEGRCAVLHQRQPTLGKSRHTRQHCTAAPHPIDAARAQAHHPPGRTTSGCWMERTRSAMLPLWCMLPPWPPSTRSSSSSESTSSSGQAAGPLPSAAAESPRGAAACPGAAPAPPCCCAPAAAAAAATAASCASTTACAASATLGSGWRLALLAEGWRGDVSSGVWPLVAGGVTPVEPGPLSCSTWGAAQGGRGRVGSGREGRAAWRAVAGLDARVQAVRRAVCSRLPLLHPKVAHALPPTRFA